MMGGAVKFLIHVWPCHLVVRNLWWHLQFRANGIEHVYCSVGSESRLHCLLHVDGR